jgi:hypothetical protein
VRGLALAIDIAEFAVRPEALEADLNEAAKRLLEAHPDCGLALRQIRTALAVAIRRTWPDLQDE